MRNKQVGFLIMGLSLVIGVIIFIFNKGLKDIVAETCTHGPTCSMYSTISLQTWISLAIAALIFGIGLFFVFTKENEKIIIKSKPKKRISLEGLDKEEKRVIALIQEENGAIFQATLMEKMEMGKVKTTRLLDKLEAKQLIERKRRGMNNIIVLKQ